MGFWTALAVGVLVLLAAAISRKNQKECEGVQVIINPTKKAEPFLNRQQVLKIMSPDATPVFKGREMKNINLQQLERRLEASVWIKNAELFFDNNATLRVTIEERTPIARIFTKNNSGFYIDNDLHAIPLSERISIRLPVFTNYPSDKIIHADSALLLHIRSIALFVTADSFWTAQIAQIDIADNRTFELLPVVGNHVIQIGDANHCEEKFHHLMLFYKNVLAKAGMNKYSSINVQYPEQVIAAKRGIVGKIDSLQTVKNIQQLIAAARTLPADSLTALAIPKTNATAKAIDTVINNSQTKRIKEKPQQKNAKQLNN
jgi:cell division protein FtsQ